MGRETHLLVRVSEIYPTTRPSSRVLLIFDIVKYGNLIPKFNRFSYLLFKGSTFTNIANMLLLTR